MRADCIHQWLMMQPYLLKPFRYMYPFWPFNIAGMNTSKSEGSLVASGLFALPHAVHFFPTC